MGHPDVVSWFVAPWILFCYILQKPKRYLTFIQSKSSFTVFMDYFPIPYAPCMEYLSTFIIYPINEPNVGKYTIHGAFGYIQPLKMIEPCNPIGFAKTAFFFIREKRFVACDRCNLCQIPTTTVQMRSWSWSPMENTFLGEDLGRLGSVKTLALLDLDG